MVTVIILVCICISFFGCFENGSQINSLLTPVEDVNLTPRLITSSTELTGIEVSKNVSPAVVGITSGTSYSYSVGSGVVIAKGGYVLTNSHVIINRNSIKLYLADGSSVNATYIWGDATLDMAILKSEMDLPYLQIAPADSPSVGEDVFAIGTPLQLQFKHSVTKGIISALNRTVSVDNDGGTSYLQSLIQHDASINPGNSGGPLINLKGQVVGINTLKIESAEGMGFAIPAIVIDNVLKNVLAEGTYETAYLGVFGYDASIPYASKKLKEGKGYYVLDVQEDSPASLAGLKKGDVILAINGKNVKNMLEFKREFFAYKKEDKITLKYIQDGHNKTVEIVLKGRPNIETL